MLIEKASGMAFLNRVLGVRLLLGYYTSTLFVAQSGMGSTQAARRAGIVQAISPTTARRSVTTAGAGGSDGWT